jgi:putative FmdB family regulatory protein
MPIYEYVCHETGDVIELLRPIDQADAPVIDPGGQGRAFVRQISVFATSGGVSNNRAGSAKTAALPMGGCCPCGKGQGACAKGR